MNIHQKYYVPYGKIAFFNKRGIRYKIKNSNETNEIISELRSIPKDIKKLTHGNWQLVRLFNLDYDKIEEQVRKINEQIEYFYVIGTGAEFMIKTSVQGVFIGNLVFFVDFKNPTDIFYIRGSKIDDKIENIREYASGTYNEGRASGTHPHIHFINDCFNDYRLKICVGEFYDSLKTSIQHKNLYQYISIVNTILNDCRFQDGISIEDFIDIYTCVECGDVIEEGERCEICDELY